MNGMILIKMMKVLVLHFLVTTAVYNRVPPMVVLGFGVPITTTFPTTVAFLHNHHHHHSSSSLLLLQHSDSNFRGRFRDLALRSKTKFTTTTSSQLYSNSMKKSFNTNDQTKNDNIRNDVTISNVMTNRFDQSNIIYGILWITLITLAFTNNDIVPHGNVVEIYDAQLLQSIIDNPTQPTGLNEIYFAIFNLFAIIPILLSCLLLPVYEIISKQTNTSNAGNNNSFLFSLNSIIQNDDNDLPPQPFVIASAAVGYFAMGIYLALRRPPSNSSSISDLRNRLPSSPSPPQQQSPLDAITRYWKRKDSIGSSPPQNKSNNNNTIEWSWYTKNIWENSIVQWLSLAFIIYLPFGCHTISAIQESGWDTIWNDFLQLFTSSRFVTISCMDLFLLHMTCVSLIPYDYAVRCNYINTTSSLGASLSVTTTGSSDINQQQNSDAQQQQRGRQIAALAALIPYVGTALYIALRPSVVVVATDKNNK